MRCNLSSTSRNTRLKVRSLQIGETAADGSLGIGDVLHTTRERGSASRKVELPLLYLARHGETAWSLTGNIQGLLTFL